MNESFSLIFSLKYHIILFLVNGSSRKKPTIFSLSAQKSISLYWLTDSHHHQLSAKCNARGLHVKNGGLRTLSSTTFMFKAHQHIQYAYAKIGSRACSKLWSQCATKSMQGDLKARRSGGWEADVESKEFRFGAGMLCFMSHKDQTSSTATPSNQR